MRRKKHVTVPIAFVFLAGTVGNNAYADWTEKLDSLFNVSTFEGQIAFCDAPSDPIDVKDLPGGVQIITFINKNNTWLTGNPLVDGVENNRVLARFDPASPDVETRISVRLDVAALDGEWKIRQRLTISPEGTSGFSIGIGRGDLRGKFIIYGDDTPSPFVPIENPPCEVPDGYPAPFIIGLPVKGKVISVGWSG